MFGLSSAPGVTMLELLVRFRMRMTLSGIQCRSPRTTSSRSGIALGLLIVVLAAAGCTGRGSRAGAPGALGGDSLGSVTASSLVPQRQKTLSQDAKGLLRVNSVFVAPVQFSDTARGDTRRQEQFNDQLEQAAARALSVEFVTPSVGKERGAQLATGSDLRAAALQSAKRLNLDAVLFTTITTVHDREGGALGADSPASFGFKMELVRGAGMEVVWSTSYISHDEALSSNLFKLPQKIGPGRTAGWLSLEAISAQGFDEALEDLSKRRQAVFFSE
jgi:hypothetical protein